MKRTLILGTAVAVAFAVGFGMARLGQAAPDSSTGEASKYPLIAKRVFTDNPNDALMNFTSLRTAINQRFSPLTEPYSFYFEYLPTGTTIRVEGENQLVAASLVKLPLVMNLYHAAELGRVNLDDTVSLTEDDLDPSFGDLYKKGAGTKLTLKEAASIALSQSDNTAARLINRSLNGKLKGNEESLPWLDINYDMQGGEAVISARGYSSILKCIYFACYLKPDGSQAILSSLTQTPFNTRITKNIPSNVKVAHKIGVFNPDNVHSDCGIFYVPQRPYLLCMMMKGEDADVSATMAETSKEVYDYVNSR